MMNRNLMSHGLAFPAWLFAGLALLASGCGGESVVAPPSDGDDGGADGGDGGDLGGEGEGEGECPDGREPCLEAMVGLSGPCECPGRGTIQVGCLINDYRRIARSCDDRTLGLLHCSTGNSRTARGDKQGHSLVTQ